RGTLPARAYRLVAARYALPIGAAFRVAFATGRPPALEHTLPGRLRGIAQTVLMAYALAPKRGQEGDKARRLLLRLAASLSVASGTAQAVRVVYPGRRRVWPLQPTVMAPPERPTGSIMLIGSKQHHLQGSPRREHV
ncbi:MAG: hypothetical protein ACRDG4_05010, partial [Chloroflexota bacterium]